MLDRDIVKPNGAVYMTVSTSGNLVEFKNFGPDKITVMFDVKTLDQVIPALQEINFFYQAANGTDI
jgi:hypothetical protein